jgi:hypothetical protein
MQHERENMRDALEQNPFLIDRRKLILSGIGVGLSASSWIPGLSAQQTSPPAPQTGAGMQAEGNGWGPFNPSSRAGQYFEVSYPASQAEGKLQIAATYKLWLPDNVQTVRAIIVHQHGASIPAAQAGATAVYDLHWQALAKKWNCALLGPSYRVLNDAIDLTPGGAELWFDPRHGSNDTFLRALIELASKSGNPELAIAPWCLWGHSGGGIWSDVMCSLHPERVVAAYLRSGTAIMFRSKPEFPQPVVPKTIYGIPMMTNAGVLEKQNLPWDGSIAAFKEYRSHGTPIGFAPDPKTGHFCGDSRYLAIPFFDACLTMRLPDGNAGHAPLRPIDTGKGWLAPLFGEKAVPASEFTGNPLEAVWLPNENIARIWTEYVQSGTVCDVTPPSAPFHVRVTAQSDQTNEIHWEAEADFESGIGAFVVLRDGRGIARLPEMPPDRVFGRPLFQGLSFHDTPEAPFPQMVYVDKRPVPGKKHVYTLITLNSAGVASQPSDPASAS